MPEGKIVKALSGFYYVESEGIVYQCRGRGVFRMKKITPLVGDYVSFDLDENDEGYIQDVGKRKNDLIRPPIANVDQAIVVASGVEPDFSPLLLDRFLVLIESKGIQPIILITKIDLLNDQEKTKIDKYKTEYEAIGYNVLLVSAKLEDGLEAIRPHLSNRTSVIAGQSGVGKSSLLNALNPNLNITTNHISKSLGRGKHTTRHVELVEVNNGLVADTPGFSSLEFQDLNLDEIGNCFPEMEVRKSDCKFRGCMHVKEPKCAVKVAVENGEITAYRYKHYLQFVEEIQNRKPRY